VYQSTLRLTSEIQVGHTGGTNRNLPTKRLQPHQWLIGLAGDPRSPTILAEMFPCYALSSLAYRTPLYRATRLRQSVAFKIRLMDNALPLVSHDKLNSLGRYIRLRQPRDKGMA